jgi:hypothetical protein
LRLGEPAGERLIGPFALAVLGIFDFREVLGPKLKALFGRRQFLVEILEGLGRRKLVGRRKMWFVRREQVLVRRGDVAEWYVNAQLNRVLSADADAQALVG